MPAKHLAGKIELLVFDIFGQKRGVILDEVEGEPVFPGIERSGRNQCGLAGEGSRRPNDELLLMTETGALQSRRPSRARAPSLRNRCASRDCSPWQCLQFHPG